MSKIELFLFIETIKYKSKLCKLKLQRGKSYAFPTQSPPHTNTISLLLHLLLGADVVGVSTLLLTAVGGTGVKSSITLPTDHLFTVVLLGQALQCGFNDTSSQTENQVKGGF